MPEDQNSHTIQSFLRIVTLLNVLNKIMLKTEQILYAAVVAEFSTLLLKE